MMKHLLLCLFTALCLGSTAQVIDDENGKTYFFYDSLTHRKVKEIFHHKRVVKIMPDPQHHGQYIDTMMNMRNGPYTRYYESGALECSGYYSNEKKDSLWKFYDKSGIMVRPERWRKGTQIN